MFNLELLKMKKKNVSVLYLRKPKSNKMTNMSVVRQMRNSSRKTFRISWMGLSILKAAVFQDESINGSFSGLCALHCNGKCLITYVTLKLRRQPLGYMNQNTITILTENFKQCSHWQQSCYCGRRVSVLSDTSIQSFSMAKEHKPWYLYSSTCVHTTVFQ